MFIENNHPNQINFPPSPSNLPNAELIELKDFFQAKISNIKHIHFIKDTIPTKLINDTNRKVSLAAATLHKWGLPPFSFIARIYQLSFQEQDLAKSLVDLALLENLVSWKEISHLDEHLLDPVEINFIREVDSTLKRYGIEGKFEKYLNKVGNYKSVFTVMINKKKYVIRRVNENYIKQYEEQKLREHRPDFITFKEEEGDSNFFLSEFMGSETFDPTNEEHLTLICQLVKDFSSEGANETSTIDFNLGNIVFQDGKVYYIDKDLKYSKTQENVFATNLNYLIDFLKSIIFEQQDLLTVLTKINYIFRGLS